MKQFYLLLIAATCVSISNAQLTMANHAPVAGELHQRYQCDSTGILPGPGGANVLWNFSVATRSSVVHSYTAGTSTYYPPATVSVTSNRGYEDHYRTSASALLDYSSSFPLASNYYINLNYNSPSIKARYPMALNTTSTTSISGYINAIMVTPQAGSFSGTSNTIADGTGTLVLPGRTYTNVTRVVNTEVISYVVSFNGSITLRNYEFYAPGAKQPVFSIMTATLTRPIGTVRRTLVTRLIHQVPAAPVDLTAENDKMICDNLPATLTASGEGTIEWFDDAASPTPVASGSVFVTAPLPPGVYTYYAQASSFLTSQRTAITFTVSDCTSLGAASEDTKINVFPNPASGEVLVECVFAGDFLEVYGSDGSLVARQQTVSGINTLDLKHQPEGIYLIKLIHQDHVMSVKKVLVLKEKR